MAFKMKMKGFPKIGPVKPKSMMEAEKKPQPYGKKYEPGFEEPEKVAYSRRVLNPRDSSTKLPDNIPGMPKKINND